MDLVLPEVLRPAKRRVPLSLGCQLEQALLALGRIEGVLDSKLPKTRREREDLIRRIILDATNKIIMGVEI